MCVYGFAGWQNINFSNHWKKAQEEEDTAAARKKEQAKRHKTKDDETLKRVNGSEDHDDNDPDTVKTRIRKQKKFQ